MDDKNKLVTAEELKYVYDQIPTGLPGAISYLTTAPTEDNPNGLMIVVLSEEPTVKYSGYLYVITD